MLQGRWINCDKVKLEVNGNKLTYVDSGEVHEIIENKDNFEFNGHILLKSSDLFIFTEEGATHEALNFFGGL